MSDIWMPVEAPDGTYPLLRQEDKVIGYRTFDLYRDMLISPVKQTRWEQKEMVAECSSSPYDKVDGIVYTDNRSRARGHLLHKRDRCGINLFKNLIEHGYDTHPVTAEVQAFGIVRVHELGYRCEEVSILRMWVNRDALHGPQTFTGANNKRPIIADELQHKYNVPVNVTDKKGLAAIVGARGTRINMGEPPKWQSRRRY